jgi:hypothetical protein
MGELPLGQSSSASDSDKSAAGLAVRRSIPEVFVGLCELRGWRDSYKAGAAAIGIDP